MASTPDPGKVRAYENDRRRHLARADALLDSIAEQAKQMQSVLQVSPRSPGSASDARKLAADAVELVERLAALEALNEVAYLTEGDSDG